MSYPRTSSSRSSDKAYNVSSDCGGTVVVAGPFEQTIYEKQASGWVLDHPLSYYRKHGMAIPRQEYHLRKTIVRRPVGTFYATCSPVPYSRYRSGVFIGSVPDVYPVHSFRNDLAVLATNDAIRRVTGGGGNIFENVGQRQQTKDMVLGTAQRLGSAFSDAKKGNFSGAARALGVTRPTFLGGISSVSDAWLAMKYGWLPLIEDVFDVFEAMQPLDHRSVLSVAGYARDHHNQYDIEDVYDDGKVMNYHAHTSQGSARCELVYTVFDGDLLRASQLGCFNPLSLAWNLLPYSFIVDWFLPIGTYFDQLGLLGMSFSGGSVSVKGDTSDVITGVVREVQADAYGNTESGRSEYGGRLITLDRTVHISEPSFIPKLHNPWSVSHGLNFAALLGSALKSFH